KRLISRSFIVTSIAILSSVVVAFRIDSREAGERSFLVNSFMTSPPRFSVEIFGMADSGVASGLGSVTHREFRGLVTLLGYNPIAFHPDRTFSSRRPISRAFA